MRLSNAFFCLSLLAFSLALPTLASHNGLRRRQDGSDGPSTAAEASGTAESVKTSIASTEEPASAAPSSTAAATTDAAAESSTASSTATEAAATTTAAVASTTASGGALPSASPTSTNIIVVYPGHGLPLPPKLTPAMAVAGALLIVTGVVYGISGARTRWIFIPVSSGYLVAISVTVLIEYTASPPVTDAVQGAFVVAASVSGAIFGAISLIFPDITEGFGCLLGGFCLSMWFMVLKEGGLITATAGKIPFIVVLSAVCYSLSFFNRTRSYTQIGCTSFAGSTALVIGIDCFTRAGLKEFWLYIWDLNDKIFPLKTNTYPVTRAIRVEIALVFVLALFGVVSQMKLWKLVKRRHAARNARRLEKEQNDQREEEENGRRVMEATARERIQWEAMYGDKPAAVVQSESTIDSASETIKKGAVSVREVDRSDSGDSLEMSDFGRSKEGSENDLMGARTSGCTAKAQDDDIQRIDTHGNQIARSARLSSVPSLKRNSASLVRRSIDRKDSLQTNTSATKLGIGRSTPPPQPPSSGPPVIPLPFTVSSEDDSGFGFLEQNSEASLMEEMQEESDEMPDSKRVSNTTSLAATLDVLNEELSSLPALSRANTPMSMLSGRDFKTVSELALGGEEEDGGDNDDATTHRQKAFLELTASNDPNLNKQEKGERVSLRLSGASGTGEENSSSHGRSRSKKLAAQSDSGHSGAKPLAEHLPPKVSRCQRKFRTNEWTKHITLADKPEIEDIPEPSSPGVAIEMGRNLDEPKITAKEPKTSAEEPKASAEEPKTSAEEPRTSATRPPGPRKRWTIDGTQMPGTKTSRHSFVEQSSSTLVGVYTPESEPLGNGWRTSSDSVPKSPPAKPQFTRMRSSSASPPTGTELQSNSWGFRASSSPLMTPIVQQTVAELPVEESEAARSPPPPRPTLLDHRKTLMKNKAFTMSFQEPPTVVPSDSISNRGTVDKEDEDDMTLAKRRTLIMRRQSMEAQQRRRQSAVVAPMKVDSRQPKRETGTYEAMRRETMMANWRMGVKQELETIRRRPAEIDEQRLAALMERQTRQAMEKKQQEAWQMEKQARPEYRAWTPAYTDLHSQLLGKMQAKANKHA
ncbi:uncharacterized protein K452DRAFT_350662 [Aplosporella prunicola CBS 121167]|uniref:TM7S3/TM198-like domain-containing protein n=1 Tax=Aplosporella prunicola CBS 121167 TaxID=1176127 RepID=A0A6A6BFQ3_9PEZI|nr:uncharacterized protein K452DRAFT_350662 [Aplosporella prunicola CBS 121167]KAF2142990.1 hypothetical protein K452DRAFT_350662 [Aplosporella prunicola CBS 121167]